MNEYLAYTCATTGGLLAALSEDQVDDELLTGAGEITDALLNGGPAQGIGDYDDGVAVIEAYLAELETRATSLHQFLTVSHIRRFAQEQSGNWDERASRGWTPERRDRIVQTCASIMEWPTWKQQVLDHPSDSDDQSFSPVYEAAKILNLDLWPTLVKRVTASPDSAWGWYTMMEACNELRIGEVVSLTRQLLPLQKIASGPADVLGFGPEFKSHQCLEAVLQNLGQYPTYGVDLIETALRSPVPRSRNLAIKTLSQWGRERWPEGMPQKLHAALKIEPNEDVRKSMQKLLDGESIH